MAIYNLEFAYPTKVIFGEKKLNELANIKLPGKKALIVITADRIVEKMGYLQETINLLKNNNCESVVYDGIKSNPKKSAIMAGAKIAINENCDFVIGLGGGSSVDSAKCIAVMMKMPGDIWDYALYGTGLKKPITDAAPIIAISTTSGTGTETDGGAVITHDETQEKVYVSSFLMRPTVSIIDYTLMTSLPPALTAYQGYDAIAHASECFISRDCSQLAEMFALEVLRITAKWLPVAYKEPNNLEARGWMAYAANILGGMVQTMAPTTSPHTIGEAISGMFPTVQHGASLAVIAEAYYTKYASKIADRMDIMGEAMGEKPDGTGMAYVRAITKILDETNIREIKLSEHGVQLEDIKKIAHNAHDVVGFSADRFDIPLEEVEEILKDSYR